jgi:hypothetical protein
MSIVKFAEEKNAVAFKNMIEEAIASKVVDVLDVLKVEVASTFFNPEVVAEAGGISGGVSRVWKKPKAPKSIVHSARGGANDGAQASAPKGAGPQVVKR